jgi:hypothetical protein
MMREMTEGCAKTLNALFFLWMALMNVYPGDFQVNSFFGIIEKLWVIKEMLLQSFFVP